MSYTPQPGTLPHKAIEYLKLLPPGASASSSELAEVLEADTGNLATYLMPAVKAGALKRFHKPGNKRLWHYAVGNGAPVEAGDDQADDDRKPLSKPAPTPDPVIASPFRLGERLGAKPDETEQKAAKPKQEPAKPEQAARFGVFSDGTMTIERGAAFVSLTAEEANRLADFVIARVVTP